MTIEEIKEKLAAIVQRELNQVGVKVYPREEQPDFSLSITAMEVESLGTTALVALLDLGRDAGMEVFVRPCGNGGITVELLKEPVTLAF